MQMAGFDLAALEFGFAIVKFGCYPVIIWLTTRRLFPLAKVNPLLPGWIRTIIGLAIGYPYNVVVGPFLYYSFSEVNSIIFFITGVAILRILEWWLVVWFFYDRQHNFILKQLKVVAMCTALSFVTDVPALLYGILLGRG
jgi:hypothetical protein